MGKLGARCGVVQLTDPGTLENQWRGHGASRHDNLLAGTEGANSLVVSNGSRRAIRAGQ